MVVGTESVPQELDQPDNTDVKELTVSKTVHNEQETYTKQTCSSELESFQTHSTNSDSNSSGNSELNRTLLYIDLVSLNKICHPKPMPKSKVQASRHCGIDIKKLKEYNKSNQNLVSSTQKLEGEFCTL